MLRALLDREGGAASLEGAAGYGHRPHRFQGAALGDAGLAGRLAQAAALGGHSGAVNALGWTEGGELLASGGEDCRLRLWRSADGQLLHSLDTGHTANILAVAFLPASHGDQLICCSADHQIRHLNITKGAVRPYLVHQDRVRAVAPMDPHTFLSASEDGTVREFDVRQRPAAVHREALAGDDSNVLVDQRAERWGRSRDRVGIHSLALDQERPWLLLTGGADPLLRLYDRRMLAAAPAAADAAGGRGRAPQWAACFAPSHITAARWAGGGGAAPPAGGHLSAVAFARGGTEVVGSYCGELIYGFDVAAHARDVEALLHIPEAALRAPARPRSHAGRRSTHGYAASGQPQQWPPAAAAAGLLPEVAAEGGGGTAPGGGTPAALLLQAGQLLLQQQQQLRAAAGRGIAIAPSLRQLERQRRQLSRAVAAAATAEQPPRAESSRPAHWQLRPTTSTLRSPRAGARQVAPHPHQPPHEPASDSEGLSEGVGASPEGRTQQRRALRGVRRSRRIMRRRRDEAEAAEQLQAANEAAGEGDEQEEGRKGPGGQQQPAVSGIEEAASSSDSEDPGLPSPAKRAARATRRTLPAAAAAYDSAVAAAAAAGPATRKHESAGQQADGATTTAGVEAAQGPDGGGFKAPAGRCPQHQRRRQPAAMQRLDSTLGLLHRAAPLEASEVAAGGGGGTQRAQQEATVSMRPPQAAGGAAAGAQGEVAWPPPAMEVSSRPLPSASHAGLGTQLGSQQAGHEASSLNSAEPPANERVGSVAQRARADAPSVGNAPLATTAAAAAAEARQAAAEGREASTGHNRAAPAPPGFAPPGMPSGARQRQRLQPTASTGTSRPPAFGAQQHRHPAPQASGRHASRLRRHSGGLDASQHGEAGFLAAAAAGSQALPVAAAAAAAGEEQAGAAPPSQQQPEPQATMLSGRGPSVLGDFMPGQEVQQGSETQQRQASGPGPAPGSGGGGAEPRAGGGWPGAAAARRAVDSAVGAIMQLGDADEGEEVSEPLLYRRRFAGHLNLSPAAADGPPLAPQLAFLGRHSELLVSPSDDGNLFVWHYASGELVAVLQPPAPAASSRGSAEGRAAAAAPRWGACVAPHPLLPLLASGGADATVRIWSPEAERRAGLEHAAAAVQANLECLAAAGGQLPHAAADLAAALLAGGGGRERHAWLAGGGVPGLD